MGGVPNVDGAALEGAALKQTFERYVCDLGIVTSTGALYTRTFTMFLFNSANWLLKFLWEACLLWQFRAKFSQ